MRSTRVRHLRPATRRDLVLAEVQAGRGDVALLAERLDVSPATVRRDLQRLTEAGLITRTYGGAVLGPRSLERTLTQKELSYRRQKDAIAAYAASLVEERDVLLLDAGTTTGRLAHYLRGRAGLTVVTNGVNTLATLGSEEAIDVIVLGGQLRTPSQAMVGPVAEECLHHVVADKVFLGADGVVPERGLSCPTLEQASLKALMASQGREVFVLADHSKLSYAPFAFFAPLRRSITVITDPDATPAQMAEVERDSRFHVQVAPWPGRSSRLDYLEDPMRHA